MGKTKIMVGGLDLDLLKRSARNAVTSNALTLISGAPDTRAQYSLLISESGKG